MRERERVSLFKRVLRGIQRERKGTQEEGNGRGNRGDKIKREREEELRGGCDRGRWKGTGVEDVAAKELLQSV